MSDTSKPILGTMPVSQLLTKFAVPSIVAMLVSSLYNIIDQFFIGQSVGMLGNAATNIAFPLSITCTAISLLFGIGGAASFNISMGAGKKETAAYYIGNSVFSIITLGVIMCIICRLFLTPMLTFFGATDQILAYAKTYTGITALGFPFLILSIGGGHLIRADGSPHFSMYCNLIGALINTILDPVFIFGFNMGMAGAAIATVIGQAVSACMVINYLCHYKTVPLKAIHFRPRIRNIGRVIKLGAAPFFNQISMMVVQIVMNRTMTYYGSLSIYGSEIPLACSGIISKVNMVFFAFIIGISQGLQPIASFNYGAGRYDRVKESLMRAGKAGLIISLIAFGLFQIFPKQIILMFGSESDMYLHFAERYFRIFLLFTFANFLQPISSNFFTAIDKAPLGILLSLTRQIIFLLPLIVIFPYFMGIDGIMYAGPCADLAAAILALVLDRSQLRRLMASTPEKISA